ncbi:CRE-SRJ-8 protein [Caenorhabditis remanei]|uniref:CRE-SRJ-8 protein n=1 Tax=Caenorhabditis remanei TaxID=31234 RepID=E3LJU2_CAERE|nr:CRE-SRJ-8 protein [Caenorhabditis remanei]
MIYISWYHQNFPRIFGVFSYIINPIFIYLALTKSKSQMGNYRFLLVAFAVFDLFYSTNEFLTPLAVTGNSHGFVVFLTEGPFFDHPEIGAHAISNRCGFISLSYALLIIHFVYRYIALFHPELHSKFFHPVGVLIYALFLFIHGASWSIICQQCLSGNDEIRELIRDEFMEEYHADTRNVPMLAALYWVTYFSLQSATRFCFQNAPYYIQFRGWLGIGLLTVISFYAMTVYFVLGYKPEKPNYFFLFQIMIKIRAIQASSTMSKNSIRLQKKLFLTLIIQTCIPIFASFLPTVLSWYAPIFGIDLSWWNTNVATVALSAFPFIDPLAVIYLVPSYRNAVLRRRDPTVASGSATQGKHVSKIDSGASVN